MKFFLDENFPKSAKDFLATRGHEVFDIRGTADEGLTARSELPWAGGEGISFSGNAERNALRLRRRVRFFALFGFWGLSRVACFHDFAGFRIAAGQTGVHHGDRAVN